MTQTTNDNNGWKSVASMDRIKSEHPDWNQYQCRAEFNRLATKELERKING